MRTATAWVLATTGGSGLTQSQVKCPHHRAGPHRRTTRWHKSKLHLGRELRHVRQHGDGHRQQLPLDLPGGQCVPVDGRRGVWAGAHAPRVGTVLARRGQYLERPPRSRSCRVGTRGRSPTPATGCWRSCYDQHAVAHAHRGHDGGSCRRAVSFPTGSLVRSGDLFLLTRETGLPPNNGRGGPVPLHQSALDGAGSARSPSPATIAPMLHFLTATAAAVIGFIAARQLRLPRTASTMQAATSQEARAMPSMDSQQAVVSALPGPRLERG